MTREHKLALIVGFSLVLLVGVLISDHLSRATRAEVATVGPEESRLVEAPLREPVAPLRVAAQTPPAGAGVPQGAVAPGSDPGGVAAPGSSAVDSPVTIAQGNQPGPTRDANPALPERDDALVSAIEAAGGQLVDGPGGRQAVFPNQGPAPDVIQPTGSKPVQGNQTVIEAAQWHSVRPGETLFKISERYYGTGHAWRKLAEANRDRVGANGTVREGVRLKIPAKAAVVGTPGGAGAAPQSGTPKAEPKPKATNGKTAIAQAPAKGKGSIELVGTPRTYTVQHGDTLGGIAKKVLGSTRRQQELIKANRDVIDDEDTIEVGMILKVPSV